MIAITTIDGVLRIHSEVPIPNAEAKQWSHARLGRLAHLIHDFVLAAEEVDSAAQPQQYRSVLATVVGEQMECTRCAITIMPGKDESTPSGSMHEWCAAAYRRENPEDW